MKRLTGIVSLVALGLIAAGIYVSGEPEEQPEKAPAAIDRAPPEMLDTEIRRARFNEILKMITPLDSHVDYSLDAARKIEKDFAGSRSDGAGTESVREYIKEKLNEKNHCLREKTDYGESVSQIDKIENYDYLYLIKGYVDYFDQPGNVAKVFELMEHDLKNTSSEEGGLVLMVENEYELVGAPSDWENDNGSYVYPHWFKYVDRIGIFHFHASSEDCTRLCGPSGEATPLSDVTGGSDLGTLRGFDNHPYEIDLVITKLKGPRFNADIYFRDPGKKKTTVIDLGIYEK